MVMVMVMVMVGLRVRATVIPASDGSGRSPA